MPAPQMSSVDFAHWARQQFWSADEATALSYGRDPKTFWNDDITQVSSSWGHFVARRDDLARALTRTMRPADCLAWAERNGVEFPADLMQEMRKHEHDVYYKVEEQARELAALRAAQVASPATSEGPLLESASATAGRKKARTRNLVKSVIAKLYPNGVPAHLTPKKLCGQVKAELEKMGADASDATILRGAGIRVRRPDALPRPLTPSLQACRGHFWP